MLISTDKALNPTRLRCSSGSVISKFKGQIVCGGPVSQPAITRFFMTVTEAARLVLQATSKGQSGQVLALPLRYRFGVPFLGSPAREN